MSLQSLTTSQLVNVACCLVLGKDGSTTWPYWIPVRMACRAVSANQVNTPFFVSFQKCHYLTENGQIWMNATHRTATWIQPHLQPASGAYSRPIDGSGSLRRSVSLMSKRLTSCPRSTLRFEVHTVSSRLLWHDRGSCVSVRTPIGVYGSW